MHTTVAHGRSANRAPRGLSAAPRAAVWTVWAALLLIAYYYQLWRAIWTFPGWVDAAALVLAVKYVAALSAIALAGLFVAVPVGLLLERLLGWPLLPAGRMLGRRALFGSLPPIAVAGAFPEVPSAAAQVLAGASLPFAAEAAVRALSGMFGLLVVLAAALPAGRAVCRLVGLQPLDWRDELLAYTCIGLGVVAAACGLLAVAGLFTPGAIRIAVAAMVIAGLPSLHALARRAGRWSEPPAPKEESAWFRRGLQAITAAALVIAGVTALAPEIEYDALWYHLGLPQLWLAAGRPVDLVHEYVSLYPLTWEFVFTAGLVNGGVVAARLLHFVCLPLGGLLVWQLSRRVAPRSEPWLAVALFVTAPTVLWEATTAYVDLALAVQIGLAVLALLRYVDTSNRGWLAVAVLSFGLALAIKHLALVALAIVAPGFALWRWRYQQRGVLDALKPAVLLVALALLIPAPWYLRNWFASGNPVFPELFGLFGAYPAERWDALAQEGLRGFKARFGTERTLLNLLRLPWDMTVHAARFGGTLGPLFVLLFPALLLFRRSNPLVTWLGGFVLLFVAVWASPISSYQLRFLVAIAPILAVLGGEAYQRLSHAAPAAGRGLLAGVFLALLSLNLPPFTPLHERDRVEWDGWLTHVVHAPPLGVVLGRESSFDYLARNLPTYAAWQFVNAHAPDDARVLTFRGGDHFYTHRARLSSVSPMARAAVWMPAGEEAAAHQELRRLGVTHMLVDRRSLQAAESVLLGEEMQRQGLERIYEDGGAVVFRVR